MLESTIESYFQKKCAKNKILCIKFISPGHSGVPDRMLITESGRIAFVELKKQDGVVSEKQKKWIRMLKERNIDAYVAFSKKDCDDVIKLLSSDSQC